MAFLVIAGRTIEVQTNGAQRRANVIIGSKQRSYSGRQRSTVQAEKRVWTFTTAPMSLTTANLILADIDMGAEVACSGDALGATVTCHVTMESMDYLPDDLGFKVVLSLTLEEV